MVRRLGIGYTGGSSLLLVCLIAVLSLWYWSQGTISVNTVSTPRVEAFYWAAITFSQTLPLDSSCAVSAGKLLSNIWNEA
jgi:uncharacterized membrane-anchored protein